MSEKFSYTLQEIANHLQAELRGNSNSIITGLATLAAAKSGQISFLYDVRYQKLLSTTAASAVIIAPKHAELYPGDKLIVKNPHLGYAKAAEMFARVPEAFLGVHPTAVIGENCKIAKTASIGAQCVLGNHVQIGEHAVIRPGTVIGDNCVVGNYSNIWSKVTIYYNVRIGNRVVIQSGVVIGSDGFGMANDNGKWHKIPQLGGVVIGDDVEIGANTCIDRGALEDTVIAAGVKLDNLIQIAHNVHIGEHTIIAACTGIAGSATIGKHCMIGGASMINGHLEIPDGVMLTAATAVASTITEPGIYSSGLPLQPHKLWRRNIVRFAQLNEMAQRLQKLEKELALLRQKI